MLLPIVVTLCLFNAHYYETLSECGTRASFPGRAESVVLKTRKKVGTDAHSKEVSTATLIVIADATETLARKQKHKVFESCNDPSHERQGAQNEMISMPLIILCKGVRRGRMVAWIGRSSSRKMRTVSL